jgi:hypothetical protein
VKLLIVDSLIVERKSKDAGALAVEGKLGKVFIQQSKINHFFFQ